MRLQMDLSFYKNKRVFITGHTGFKGAWLSFLLLEAGAEVTGYSLNPPTTPSLYKLCKLDSRMNSVIGDVRDYKKLKKTFVKHLNLQFKKMLLKNLAIL